MAQPTTVTLDVRPDLRSGKEPFGKIMAAVEALADGQSLRLLATFEPLPLYRVLETRGFTHQARQLGTEDWRIVFSPGGAGHQAAPQAPVAAEKTASAVEDWPAPTVSLDNRQLLPPEPMMRILQTLETLQPGQVLAAVNERDPLFLYPELEARGHAIRVEKRPDGVYLEIRRAPTAR